MSGKFESAEKASTTLSLYDVNKGYVDLDVANPNEGETTWTGCDWPDHNPISSPNLCRLNLNKVDTPNHSVTLNVAIPEEPEEPEEEGIDVGMTPSCAVKAHIWLYSDEYPEFRGMTCTDTPCFIPSGKIGDIKFHVNYDEDLFFIPNPQILLDSEVVVERCADKNKCRNTYLKNILGNKNTGSIIVSCNTDPSNQPPRGPSGGGKTPKGGDNEPSADDNGGDSTPFHPPGNNPHDGGGHNPTGGNNDPHGDGGNGPSGGSEPSGDGGAAPTQTPGSSGCICVGTGCSC